MDTFEIMLNSLEEFGAQMAVMVPKMLGAILLFIVGWLIAKLIKRLLIKMMHWLRLDVLAEKSGVEDFLVRGGVKFTATTLVATTVYWILLLAIVLAILRVVGVRGATDLLDRILLYIPNVIIAMIVLISGALWAKFIQGLVYAYLNNIGMKGAEAMSAVARYAILIFVVSVALEQLAIGGEILISAFQLAFGALCLALALAFGLGGKEWAAGIIDRTWNQNGRK